MQGFGFVSNRQIFFSFPQPLFLASLFLFFPLPKNHF